ncbi:MAG: hypothetical protein DRR42_25795 [Gammaproteobacteria bacterium]|nr:MAG: hypothetical protein DRR42_25795 [Gammaproteobacteria bacterium]
MDRRGFFKTVFRSTTWEVVKHADAKVKKDARRWIRPPYAINELDFLLSCTRCGDCIQACPHDVIFPLSARVGAKAVGTPALDLLNKGCHLCKDWPCVQACNETALSLPVLLSSNEALSNEALSNEAPGNQAPAEDLPKDVTLPLPRLASASINTQSCLPYSGPECGACEASCPVPGALVWDQHRPAIDDAICVGCGLCRQACIIEPSAVTVAAQADAGDTESHSQRQP